MEAKAEGGKLLLLLQRRLILSEKFFPFFFFTVPLSFAFLALITLAQLNRVRLWCFYFSYTVITHKNGSTCLIKNGD